VTTRPGGPSASHGSGDASAGDAAVVRRAFEEMPLALVALQGPEHRFVAANAAYRTIVGRAEVVGRTVREVAPEVGSQQLFEMLDRVYRTGEAVVAREWRVQLNRGPGGAPDDVFLDMNVLPRRGPAGDTVGLLVYIADVTGKVRERQAAERHASEAERRYRAARDVVVELQEALLPTALPVLPGATVAARYLVAAVDQAAGGDWFDAVPLPDGRLALVVGDVVGHGVAASAAMGQLRAVLGELLRDAGESLQALHRIDRMATRVPVMRAATVCVAVLDPTSGELTYGTCGHPPPIVIGPDGRSRCLAPSGAGPLGTGSPPATSTDALRPGEVLLLYSDGLVERPGQPVTAGIDRLARIAGDAVVNRAMPAGSPESADERVAQQCVELITREGYDDDVTVLAAMRRPSPVPEMHLRGIATPGAFADFRASTRAWLDRLGADPTDRRAIDLAVAELVANAIEHAYPVDRPGPIRLDAKLCSDGLARVRVADEGDWVQPSAPPPTSGRGLWIVGSVVDEIALDHHDTTGTTGRRGRGTTVTIRHRLGRPVSLGAAEHQAVRRGAPHRFSLAVRSGTPSVLAVSGSLDMTTVSAFAERLAAASRGGMHPVTVDLSEVDVLASAGVSALFAARDQYAIHGQRLTLVAPPGGLAARVLDLATLDHVSPATIAHPSPTDVRTSEV